MSKEISKEDMEGYKKDYEAWGMKNWRAWGSWFSWGSPVGLGLFFIEVAVTVWIFAHLTR